MQTIKFTANGHQSHEKFESKCDASKYNVIDKRQAEAIFGAKSIFIWGAGQKGQGFYSALLRNGFELSGFIDSSTMLQDRQVLNKQVLSPENFFELYNPKNAFVLLASVDKKNKEIANQLETKGGFVKGDSYLDIQTLCPFYPTVEITGICNLKCSSCIRSDKELIENGKYMSLSDYKLVVDKLVKDIPFLYLVDLYVFGEPILNKDLPAIIEYNKNIGIASGISTNLNKVDQLEAVMAAKPAQLRVSISGMSKETYEVTHTGGKWAKVEKNLMLLRDLRNKYGQQTIVEFYFHIYKHNIHEIPAAKKLCEEYGFRFHPSLAVLFSDFALNYRKTGVMNQHAKTASDLTVLTIDELLSDCDEYSDKGCILTRIVPVINWDLSVMPCCNYAYSKIHTNYLEIDFNELIFRRTYSSVCEDCQKNSMHRWNDQMRYSGLVGKLVGQSIENAVQSELG